MRPVGGGSSGSENEKKSERFHNPRIIPNPGGKDMKKITAARLESRRRIGATTGATEASLEWPQKSLGVRANCIWLLYWSDQPFVEARGCRYRKLRVVGVLGL